MPGTGRQGSGMTVRNMIWFVVLWLLGAAGIVIIGYSLLVIAGVV